MNIGGETFVGDANIWTAQLKEGLNMISGADAIQVHIMYLIYLRFEVIFLQ